MSDVKLILGNCYEILPTLDPKSVDAVISDPPYDERTHSGAITHQDGDKKSNQIDFDHLGDPAILVREYLRVSRRWCLAFCTLEQIGFYAQEAYKTKSWVRAGVWDRINPPPQFTGDRPSQAVDGIAIWHSTDEKKRWNGKGYQGIWRYSVEFGKKQHPTQKPLPLMLKLVAQFTDVGETIIDPFMGGGTTGVAAARLGRNFIGIEKDPEYFEIAQQRISTEQSQYSLPTL